MAISAGIIAAATVGSAVYSANQSNKARKSASSLAQDDQRRADQQLKEFSKLTEPKAVAEKEKSVSGEARKRQQTLARQAVGRRSTILTGPLGIPGTPETSGKTLLGE